MIKIIVNNYFQSFSYFYTYIGNKILMLIVLSICVGFLDGIGLAMLLPLLQMSTNTDNMSTGEMGNLAFLTDFLEQSNISLTFNVVLIFIVSLFVFKGAMRYMYGYYNTIIQQSFMSKIRLNGINLLSNYKYSEFVFKDAGRIQNTLSTEVQRVNIAYIYYFNALQSGIFIFIYFMLAFFANPQFSLLVIGGGLIANLLVAFVNKRTKSASDSVSTFNHVYQEQLIEFVSNFKYLKATSGIFKFSDRIENTIKTIENNNKTIGLLQSFLLAVREPIVVVLVMAVIFIQITFFAKSMGMIILSLLFFYRALEYLMRLQAEWNAYMGVSGTMRNMYSFFDELTADQDEIGEKKVVSLEQKLELQDVSFNYKKTNILSNISLSIGHNQTIAFAGESGSGKTTLVNIISGLLSPLKGNYKIDGIDSSEIFMSEFQHRIGYVTQDPVIFNDTIYNNVTFWAEKTEVNLVKFYRAISQASISDYIKGLPKNEDTLLGSNGVLISGGQKQRISIARELYRDIDILVMDEATSALDSETEQAIQENILKLKGKYTIIVIAHRLFTIKNADKIIYLKKGKILAKGTFDELMATNGEFKKAASLQMM